MGIRGAWSVVSSDPRRFGEPWVCSSAESVIWIDGPSLVYYLALQPKFDEVSRFHERYNQLGQASPACIYKRTTNFITVLTELAKEVHVVMDGACTTSKIATQVERMKVAAQQADAAARSKLTPRNCKVISVLAEWTVVDAIEKLQARIATLQLHRLSTGEAEGFIDFSMKGYKNKDGVVIMSNDTDFLVYEHCPGFLPFNSIQFTPMDERNLGFTGFHYLRSKFKRAFFANHTDIHIMTSVAALAGCDYDDELLQAARSTIVKSKIGGLRIKHQNNPTMQSVLTAILRFVRHYTDTGDSWRKALVETIGGDAVLESLNRIHEAYFQEISNRTNSTISSIEYHRLFDSGTFFCRPLIEKCSSPPAKSVTKTRRAPTLSKRSRRRRKRKLLEASVGADEDTVDISDPPPVECIDVTCGLASWDYQEIRDRNGSIWTLEHFKRVRALLYDAMLSTSTADTKGYIAEWRRVGIGETLEYQETRISILTSDVVYSIEGMIQSCDVSQINLSSQTRAIDLTTALLPPKVRWVWPLLMAMPRRASAHQRIAKEHDLDIANLMCLAYFHSRLAIEVLMACTQESQLYKVRNDQSLEKLDTDAGSWIFGIIQDMELSDLPEKFFDFDQITGTDFGDEWRSNLRSALGKQD